MPKNGGILLWKSNPKLGLIGIGILAAHCSIICLFQLYTRVHIFVFVYIMIFSVFLWTHYIDYIRYYMGCWNQFLGLTLLTTVILFASDIVLIWRNWKECVKEVCHLHRHTIYASRKKTCYRDHNEESYKESRNYSPVPLGNSSSVSTGAIHCIW